MELWPEGIYYIGFSGRSDLGRTWPGLLMTTEKRQFLLTWRQSCSNAGLSLGSGKISLIRRWLQCLTAVHVTSHAYMFSGFKKGNEIIYGYHKWNVGIGGLGWSTIIQSEQGQIVMTDKCSELQTSIQVKMLQIMQCKSHSALHDLQHFHLKSTTINAIPDRKIKGNSFPRLCSCCLWTKQVQQTLAVRTLSNKIWTTN